MSSKRKQGRSNSVIGIGSAYPIDEDTWFYQTTFYGYQVAPGGASFSMIVTQKNHIGLLQFNLG